MLRGVPRVYERSADAVSSTRLAVMLPIGLVGVAWLRGGRLGPIGGWRALAVGFGGVSDLLRGAPCV